MPEEQTESVDERVVRNLDLAWNEAYLRNDRTAFSDILAEDFRGEFPDGRVDPRADSSAFVPQDAARRSTPRKRARDGARE